MGDRDNLLFNMEEKMSKRRSKRDLFIESLDPIIDIVCGIVGIWAVHFYSTYVQNNIGFGWQSWTFWAFVYFAVVLLKGFLKATTWHT